MNYSGPEAEWQNGKQKDRMVQQGTLADTELEAGRDSKYL
jgi:hypothetical protein